MHTFKLGALCLSSHPSFLALFWNIAKLYRKYMSMWNITIIFAYKSNCYLKRLTFKNFLIRRGQGISFFDGPTSGFTPHQLSLVHRPSLTPTNAKSYTEVHWRETGVKCALAPKVGPLVLSPKEVCDDLTQEPVMGRVKIKVKLTIRNRQAQTELILLSLPWSSKPSWHYSRDGKKQKSMKTVEITLLMRLSISPDRCNINLWPENSLEPGDWQTCGLPCWWLPLMCHHQWHHQWYGRTPSYLRTTKENILIKNHFTTSPPQVICTSYHLLTK